MSTPNEQPILEVENLATHFPIRAGFFRQVIGQVHAVDGVSLEVSPEETLGVVGESGCGKTTLGRSILRLIEPTSGTIKFEGQDITHIDKPSLRALRKDMQIVFQDPFASLNPRMPVNEIVGEPMLVHGVEKAERRQRVGDLLKRVGLLPEHGNRYPHEFSGGQRQRIGIARALSTGPKLMILDEPVSALDVSVQAQVINLLEDLQDSDGLAYLFIAHDLSVVRHISDRVAVMYLGRIVELAESDALYESAAHPYSHSLLSAVPVADPAVERRRERIILDGDLPSPANPPSGCHFHTRCPLANDRCRSEVPQLQQVNAAGHMVACHYPIQPGETLLDRVRSGSGVSL